MAEQNRGGGKADDQFTRCPHCAGPLTKEMETSKWTVSPLVREGFSMIGTAVGGIAGAVYGFNHRATCHYFLIRMCRASRWFTSGFGSTCIFILSCLSVLPTISTFVLVELGIYWLLMMVSRAVSVTQVPFCRKRQLQQSGAWECNRFDCRKRYQNQFVKKVHARLINGSAFFMD
ncbi:hypothetical protein SASPL_119383 [Salvia splendens]|uniref:Transmembrane protein n=1 Tax=Salvia splendens TaxID=180675 RepID=A0A8X8XS83_SALSN|nr:hypothetical protein SASPL_119383 [Salvia splendens]